MFRFNRHHWCYGLIGASLALIPLSVLAQDGALELGGRAVGRVAVDEQVDALTRLALRKVERTPTETDAPAPRPATLDFDEDRPLGAASQADNRGPQKRASNSYSFGESSTLLNAITALGAVLGLILVLRAIYARVTGRSAATANHPALEVLTRVAVAPRNHILLVRLGQRILVLGDSANGLTSLMTIDDPEEIATLLKTITAAQPNSISSNFSHLLNRFSHEYPDPSTPDATGIDARALKADRARGEVSGLLSRARSLAKGPSR